MNNFLKEFKDRGYFYQCTDEIELSNLLNKESIHAYIGFDSTAPSLHVGSLLQIMCLRLLQKHGHRPIVLLRWRNNQNWRSIWKRRNKKNSF